MRFLTIALLLMALPAAAHGQIGMVDQTLARFDLDTLRPIGPRLHIGEPHSAPVLSPDRRRLAIGVSARTARGFFVIDRATMQPLHQVSLDGAAPSIVYPGVVAAAPNQNDRFVVLDPDNGRVLARPSMPTFGCDTAGLTVGRRGVFVGAVAPRGGVSAMVVDADGKTHRLRIPVGAAAFTDCEGVRAARSGHRVFIAGPDAVAMLNPRTLRVRIHSVPGLGAVRDVEAVPGGLAVVGSQGLTVLDRGSWQVRWRDPRADQVTATRGVLVAAGGGIRGRSATGGRLLWSRPARHPWLSEALRGRVFVDAARRLVLDARTGRVLSRSRSALIGVGFAGA